MSDNICNRIDEMGTRIDDLEKSIADLMTQAGYDENEAAKAAETTTEKKNDESKAEAKATS
eukprot:651185-Amorphochlora_amoeboformis.AAC.2